tara:strand:- start:778 stop:1266 length:489 start_codon:yes stop_codon:yes gene_type:complete
LVEEKEFFESGGRPESVDVVNDQNDLSVKLKNVRDDMMATLALIIHDPQKHGHEIDGLRRDIIRLATAMLEHGVRLEVPKKERTAEDVIKEAAGELGSMFGAKGVAAGLSFVNKVRTNITTNREELVIYEDEAGGLYYIDEDGNEIDCDEEGNPLDGDEDDD